MNVFTLSKTLEFGETKGQWFSNDCEMVITGIPTKNPNDPIEKFQIWDINTGAEVGTFENILKGQWEYEYNDKSFALNPRGTEFIGSSSNGSACWNTRTLVFTVWGFKNQGPQEIFYNRSGDVIYSETKIGDQHVVLMYDSITKKPLNKFQFDDEYVHHRALTPDLKKYIYCGGELSALDVRSVEDGTLLMSMMDTTNGQIWGYTGIDVSHDGKRVVVGYDAEFDEHGGDGEYGYINIWDIDTGKSLLKIQTDINESPVFSPYGKLIVSGSYNGTIHIWDASTLELITTLDDLRNEGSYPKIAFNPDGSKLIVANRDRIKIWENTDWEAMKALDESMPAGMPVDIVSEIASYTGTSDVPGIVSRRNEKNLPLHSVPFAKELLSIKKRIDGGTKKRKKVKKTKQTKTSKKTKKLKNIKQNEKERFN
jgi:WD40 repeat protein